MRLTLDGSSVDEAAAADGLAEALESARPPGHPDLDPATRWTSPASSSAGRSRRRSAGAVLGIDPFDQPNVEEAKEHTRARCSRCTRRGRRPEPRSCPARAIAAADGITLYGDTPLRLSAADGTLVGELRRHLAAHPADELPRAPGVHRADRRARTTPFAADPAPAARLDAARDDRSATDRASCTRPGSCTRAARRPAGSSSSPPTTRSTARSRAGRTRSASSSTPRRAGDFAGAREPRPADPARPPRAPTWPQASRPSSER